MKAIKAYIRSDCAGAVIHALVSAGFSNVRITGVHRTSDVSTNGGCEQGLSVVEQTANEMCLQLVCEDRLFGEAVTIMFDHGQSSDAEPGWIDVSTIDIAIRTRRKVTATEAGDTELAEKRRTV